LRNTRHDLTIVVSIIACIGVGVTVMNWQRFRKP